MAISDDAGGHSILNSPMGAGLFCNSSGERNNGNHIGVWAYKLPDLSGDLFVNIDDFATFADFWQSTNCGSCGGVDIDNDHDVDFDDLAIFLANWFNTF